MLRHRCFFLAAFLLGIALALPSLRVGFVADDYTFIQRLEHAAPAPTWSLYEFATGEPGTRASVMSSRWLASPWWMGGDFKLRFLRPVASALLALDHSLFGRSPLGYHVHSLLWYALLLAGVGLLLRLVCSSPIRQVAFALFVLSAAHAEPVGWISSRHLLVASAPAMLGLVALIARRERGFRWGLPLGLAGMGLGLAGSEAALAVICYWLAYEALAEPKGEAAPTLRSRLARAALPIACVAAYGALYKGLGYGASGSAGYLDPISAPRAYWLSLPGRLAMLLGEAFAGFPANLSLTTLPGPGVALGVAFTLAIVLGCWSIWPRVAVAERRTLLWLSVGAGLGLIANAGAVLGSRLLLVPGLGLSVVLATLLCHGWRATASALGSSARKTLLASLVLIHVVAAPLLFLLNGYLLAQLGRQWDAVDESLDAHFASLRAQALQPPKVFVLAASDPFAGFYTASVRGARAPDSTAQWSILSMTRGTHRVVRTGLAELTIQSDLGLLRSTFEGLFRASTKTFRAGERAALEGAFVTVLAVSRGEPTAISLTLTRGTFDDDAICLLAWRSSQLVPVHLALHEAMTIPWSPGPTRFL